MQGFLFIVVLFFIVGTIVGAKESPKELQTVIQDSLRNELNAAKNVLSSAWNGLRSSRVVGEGQSIAIVPTSEVNTGVKTTTMTTMTMSEQVSHVALQATSVGFFAITDYYCSGNVISNTSQTSFSAWPTVTALPSVGALRLVVVPIAT